MAGCVCLGRQVLSFLATQDIYLASAAVVAASTLAPTSPDFCAAFVRGGGIPPVVRLATSPQTAPLRPPREVHDVLRGDPDVGGGGGGLAGGDGGVAGVGVVPFWSPVSADPPKHGRRSGGGGGSALATAGNSDGLAASIVVLPDRRRIVTLLGALQDAPGVVARGSDDAAAIVHCLVALAKVRPAVWMARLACPGRDCLLLAACVCVCCACCCVCMAGCAWLWLWLCHCGCIAVCIGVHTRKDDDEELSNLCLGALVKARRNAAPPASPDRQDGEPQSQPLTQAVAVSRVAAPKTLSERLAWLLEILGSDDAAVQVCVAVAVSQWLRLWLRGCACVAVYVWGSSSLWVVSCVRRLTPCAHATMCGCTACQAHAASELADVAETDLVVASFKRHNGVATLSKPGGLLDALQVSHVSCGLWWCLYMWLSLSLRLCGNIRLPRQVYAVVRACVAVAVAVAVWRCSCAPSLSHVAVEPLSGLADQARDDGAWWSCRGPPAPPPAARRLACTLPRRAPQARRHAPVVE